MTKKKEKKNRITENGEMVSPCSVKSHRNRICLTELPISTTIRMSNQFASVKHYYQGLLDRMTRFAQRWI